MAIDKKKKEKEKVVKITDEAEKKKALDTAIAAIEKQFGKGAIMRLGEDKAMDVDAISTGSMFVWASQDSFPYIPVSPLE